jgi:hypothetical protein
MDLIRPARLSKNSSPARKATAGSERGVTVRADAEDVGAKAIACAEKSVQSSSDYAQTLLHANELNEVMRLHSEYVQSRMRSLTEQASEMGQIASRAAMEAAKRKVWNRKRHISQILVRRASQ